MPARRRAGLLRTRRERSDALPLAGVAAALIAVACCAGLPALGAVLGGLTLAALIGVTGAVLVGRDPSAHDLCGRGERRGGLRQIDETRFRTEDPRTQP